MRPAVGQKTAQHLRPDIGYLVTHFLSPGQCQVLLEASIDLASFYTLLLLRAWIVVSLNRGYGWSEVTGVPTVSEITMLNVTKYVCCIRSLCISQSGAGLGLVASCQLDADPHAVCVLEVPYDIKGRT